MDKARKRHGLKKRQQRARMGAPTMPDDNGVRTEKGATDYWMESGRSAFALGFTLRVSPAEDLAAWPLVAAACKEHPRALAQRTLTEVLVAGIAPVAKQLDDIVSMSNAAEPLDQPEEPTELVVAAAAKFAGARRKAIARIAKGSRNRTLRHAFGISRPMSVKSVEEVRRACLALLEGRASHAGSAAARMITQEDVKKARDFVARLGEIKSRSGALRSSDAEQARTRDVLHAALELFYDRFGAAVDLAFEDDDGARVAMLSLIPRRKDKRAQQPKPPATGTLEHVG